LGPGAVCEARSLSPTFPYFVVVSFIDRINKLQKPTSTSFYLGKKNSFRFIFPPPHNWTFDEQMLSERKTFIVDRDRGVYELVPIRGQ